MSHFFTFVLGIKNFEELFVLRFDASVDVKARMMCVLWCFCFGSDENLFAWKEFAIDKIWNQVYYMTGLGEVKNEKRKR